MQEFTVTFESQNKSVAVPKGTDLLTAAIKCGILLNASCGGEGLCGKCKVVIQGREVLACETIVEKDIVVSVPKKSLAIHTKTSALSEEFTKGVVLEREKEFRRAPLVRRFYLELKSPTSDDNSSDLERIMEALSKHIASVSVSTKLANVKHLSEILRDSDFKVTVTVGYKDDSLEILSIEPGDESNRNYGLAFDIGTTTVTGQLLDLENGEVLGTRIVFNKQAAYGADVITRIIYASEPEGMKVLNEAVLDNINDIINELVHSNNINQDEVNAFVCAGNMTMMHLLLMIDPSNIRKAPYIPATCVFPTINLSEVRIAANPKGIISFLPGVATYIGGDIVSGVLACGLAENEDLALLVDIGTNGEIVLGNKDWMMGAAASAGPAFEGSGLSCGMKAVSGAIQKVAIDNELNVTVDVIGGELAKGICGSGYIDLLRQMLQKGIIDKFGRIDRTPHRSSRIRKTGTGYEFLVAGKDIVISDDDIENLKRSKAAIYSAIISLLNKVEKNISEVKKIYIAGGFGNYLNIENSIAIGLLPDVDRSVYQFVGNSSLAGARICLLSHEALGKARQIHKDITYLDLSAEANYMDEYVAALFFPHTDIGRFPSVRL